MDRYSNNINAYRTITEILKTNSSFNTIAGYCRIDNTRGFNNGIATSAVSANNKSYNKDYNTSDSINECNVIAGYCHIAKDNTSINIGTNNRLRTIGDNDNCLMQGHIKLPDITGLLISSN